MVNLYNPDVNDFVGGLYKVDTSNEDLFKKVGDKWYYTGNVVMEETKDIITNGGNGDTIGNTQDYDQREKDREQELKDAREGEEARERLRESAKKDEPKKDVWQPRDQGGNQTKQESEPKRDTKPQAPPGRSPSGPHKAFTPSRKKETSNKPPFLR